MLTKNGTQLEVGALVEIFEDPITEETLEGTAKIKVILAVRGMMAYCRVVFPDEREAYARAIQLHTVEIAKAEPSSNP